MKKPGTRTDGTTRRTAADPSKRPAPSADARELPPASRGDDYASAPREDFATVRCEGDAEPHRRMPDALMESVASTFRALSEASRLRLVEALMDGPKNVSELARHAGLSHANASKHLAVLAGVGLLSRRRDGSTTVYDLADDTPRELCRIMCGRVAERLRRDLAVAEGFLS